MKRKKRNQDGVTRRNFLKTAAGAGGGAMALAAADAEIAAAQGRSTRWTREADVVIVGSGAGGLPAAIAARERGATVIIVEANFDVGGHAILSGGNIALGGGTSAQKKYGVVDSPDLVFSDLTDWSVVEPNGFPDYRDETKGQFTSNNYNALKEYVPHSWRNAANARFNPSNYLNAALAGVPGEAVNGGGPIWAIFDAEAVKRENWTVAPPYVDTAAGFFFSADSLEELAHRVDNKFQRKPLPAAALQSTVERYNAFVDGGKDDDFGKPAPRFKIQVPPFYAAWATPVIHDTRVGLRINPKCQVVDMKGNVIPGLYCGGESAGGFSLHGLARCTTQGRLAGMNAAGEGASTEKSV